MKRTLLYGMMVAALALVSCTKHELDPLTGVFPEATVVELNSLTSCVAEKDAEERRVFTLDLTDGTTPMHLTLIGNKYYLTANQYIEALDAVAKNGNFVLGKSSIGGKNIKQGYINVDLLEENETANGCENTYSIAAVVFLEDGTPYKANWTGKIAFEKDAVLAPEFFFTDTVAQDCTDSDNNPYLDVESHTLVLNDASGNFAAQIKLVRSVGTKNLAGTYTVKEYAHEDLTAGNGFDLGVYFGMPAGAYVIGSYYLKDGAVVIIEPGATISVSDAGEGVYSIDGDGFSFLTAPEGWVPGGVTVCDMTDTVAQDCTLEDGSTLVEDVESHTLVLKDGEEFVAQIKLIRSVGTTDLTGTYTVKEYAHEDLSAGNGFDLGAMFGMGSGVWVIGTYYVKEGAIVIVEPGETITVTSAGENTYKFEGSSEWTFIGKLAAGGDQPGPEPQDNWDYTPSTAYNASNNLWKSTAAGHENFYYYSCTGGDWNGTDTVTQEPPFLTKKESTYKLTYEANTNDRWQNQFFITTLDGNHIALDAAKTYKFSVTVGSTESFGAFFKLEQYDANHAKHEGATIWEPEGYPNNVNLTAGSPVTLEHEFTGVEGPSINLVFDFGGNPAGAVVYIKDITLVEVGGEPAAPVTLTDFLSYTSYAQYGINLAGAELATSGFSYTAEFDWSTWTSKYTFSGDGSFIKLELYTEGDTFAPGTYTPSADPNNVAAGEFKTGSAQGGTTWNVVKDNQITSTPVTDGTVTVAKDGDVFTIEIKSSVVNAKYVGKLSAGGAAAGGITIDGNFDDWADVPSADPSDSFKAFKVTNDADNFYFYVETDPGSRLWSGGAYLYLYFNYKNDLTQGAYSGKTGMGDNKYDAYNYMFLFGGDATAPKIEDNPNGGAAEGMTLDNIVIAGNNPATASDVVIMEIVIPRANFTTQVNAGDVIEIDSYRSKDGGNVYFPGYVVK